MRKSAQRKKRERKKQETGKITTQSQGSKKRLEGISTSEKGENPEHMDKYTSENGTKSLGEREIKAKPTGDLLTRK